MWFPLRGRNEQYTGDDRMSIKRIIKNNRILAVIAYRFRSFRNRQGVRGFAGLPIDGQKILFYRPNGGYGDNPKAVAEYIHLHYPQYRLIWASNDQRFFESVPNYLKPVLFESKEYFRELATAGAWVCCSTLPYGTVKRNGQLYIQTWHGDKFLKKIANDAAADVSDYKARTAGRTFCESEICDYYVTGCEWFVPIAASALDYRGSFLRCGMPRNDCLVNPDAERCAAIRKDLGIAPDVKILIYAPTFRDYEKSLDSVGSDIDLVTILNALEKKHSCKWICLMRAHTGKHLTLNGGDIADPRFMDVTSYPDMADLLMVSDMLISDYSSCGADFAITGRMVLLYQDDIDQYTSKGRTLYFTREESPYFTASNMQEALEIIDRVTDEDIRKNSRGILDFYDSFEAGHAAETVGKVIADALDQIGRQSSEL